MQNFLNLYQKCQLCPHNCEINRHHQQPGVCQAPAMPKIAKIMMHSWEEPCISGTKGSGTVFFSHCNLHCVYCQNHPISHGQEGYLISESQLAQDFLTLQSQGVHNINLVSPTPYIPSIAEALKYARKAGLSIPVVYNTHAYELSDSLKMLTGLVDIYLPDLKYADKLISHKFSGPTDYFEYAATAIQTMFEQVGPTIINGDGLMEKGLLIRHLILPNYLDNSKKVLQWIGTHLPKSVYVSLMSQYIPVYQAVSFPEINRPLNQNEYDQILDYFFDIGLENGFMQELDSASDRFVPDFDPN